MPVQLFKNKFFLALLIAAAISGFIFICNVPRGFWFILLLIFYYLYAGGCLPRVTQWLRQSFVFLTKALQAVTIAGEDCFKAFSSTRFSKNKVHKSFLLLLIVAIISISIFFYNLFEGRTSQAAHPSQANASASLTGNFYKASPHDPQMDETKQWLMQAMDYYNQRNLKESLECAQRAAAREPGCLLAWVYIGNCCMELNELDQALEAVKKCIEIEPKDSISWNNLGNVYRRQKDYEKAAAAIKYSLKLNPNNAHAWGHLCATYWQAGKKDKAIETCEQRVKMNPDDGDAWGTLANHYEAMGWTSKFQAAWIKYEEIQKNKMGLK